MQLFLIVVKIRNKYIQVISRCKFNWVSNAIISCNSSTKFVNIIEQVSCCNRECQQCYAVDYNSTRTKIVSLKHLILKQKHTFGYYLFMRLSFKIIALNSFGRHHFTIVAIKVIHVQFVSSHIKYWLNDYSQSI